MKPQLTSDKGGTALKGFSEEETTTCHFHCYLNGKCFTFNVILICTHCHLLENWDSNLIPLMVFGTALYT